MSEKLLADITPWMEKGLRGRALAGQYTAAVDALLSDIVASSRDNAEFALLATGGYGRKELAPFSDIDIMFFSESRQKSSIAEKVLYRLWDEKLDISHAYRTDQECIEEASRDIRTRTSLLEARWLHSHVVVDGHTRLGKGNEIYPYTTVGLRTQDLKWKGGVTRTEVGNHNIIRETVTIHSATGDGESTIIGSHNAILAGSHIGHNVVMGNHIIVSMAALAGHVLVEDHAVVGGMCAVHQFCRGGRLAFIGGCAKVVQDVPPFMVVDGNPAETVTINKVGLERNGVSEEAQTALRQAYIFSGKDSPFRTRWRRWRANCRRCRKFNTS